MDILDANGNALSSWAVALACAPHVLEGANIDDPEKIRRLADSAASLHGLVHYVIENCATDDADYAKLAWDCDLLAGASSFLYRNLGLSPQDSAARINRLSGGMRGTAKHMEIDPLETWQSVRREAADAAPTALN